MSPEVPAIPADPADLPAPSAPLSWKDWKPESDVLPSELHAPPSAPLDVSVDDAESDDLPPEKVGSGFQSAKVYRDGELRFPNEPDRFGRQHVERLFVWGASVGFSDLTIQPGQQVIGHLYGKKLRVTRRSLSHSEILEMISGLYDSEAAKAALAGNNPLDFAYTARPDRNTRLRFRLNATAGLFDASLGAQITARTISSKPPSLEEMNVEPEIVDQMVLRHRMGLIMVTGATGSGKSTLLAGAIRSILEHPDANKKIITYEAPIEYVYDEVEWVSSVIAQHEVGPHLRDFSESLRNALRRAPDIILVGEARDAETIGEAITASKTGHLVYTTVHTNGFAETIGRMVNQFPEGSRHERAVDIISATKMVVSQTLVPSTDGKRVALREYVIFNDEIVDELLAAPLAQMTSACRLILKKYGRSFLQDAQEKFAQGLISEETLRSFDFSSKAKDRDTIEQLSGATMLPEMLRATADLQRSMLTQDAQHAAHMGVDFSAFDADGDLVDPTPDEH